MSILKNHRELWLASVVALAVTGTAGAADLAVKAPIIAPAPVFTWTGCYLGGHAGGGVMSDSYINYRDGTAYTEGFGVLEPRYKKHRRGDGDGEGDMSVREAAFNQNGEGNSQIQSIFAAFFSQTTQYSPADDNLWRSAGGVAGGQIGCNYQFGSFVVGVEAEGFWSGLKAKYEEAYPSDDYSFKSEFKNKSDWDVAVRLGYAIDRLLIYSKVGWAWGKFTASSSESGYEPRVNHENEIFYSPYTYNETASKTLNGLLLGFGSEYALTQNWTIKAEYNFIAYQTGAFNFAQSGNECRHHECYDWTDSYTESHNANKHIVKVGVNYLFNWGAPVVARY